MFVSGFSIKAQWMDYRCSLGWEVIHPLLREVAIPEAGRQEPIARPPGLHFVPASLLAIFIGDLSLG